MDIFNINFWLIAGIVLLALEVVSVSFYALFAGVGALITALCIYLGLVDGPFSQIIVFTLSSLGSILLFRKQLLALFQKTKNDYNEFEGETAKVITEISPDQEGSVHFRGTEWQAFTENAESLKPNSTVIITGTSGIKLKVKFKS